jgi:galactokinase
LTDPSARFLALRDHPDRVVRQFFAASEPVFVASAPGRLDVMGGIADYSGSLVLQLPLDRATVAMAQRHDESTVDVMSLRGAAHLRASIPLEALRHTTPGAAQRLGAYFTSRESHWASYVVGAAYACLARHPDALRSTTRGLRILIESDVPEGKGVSSSAALEVSTLAAVAAAFDIAMTPEQVAIAAQWAENNVAGAPCGIMDQMTSACGRAGHLLRLRCRPASIEGHVAIPDGYRFYGVDSGIRHAVTGADYGTVRTAAFMGYRIIADIARLPTQRAGSRVLVADYAWGGYLAALLPNEFESLYASHLPEQMPGAEFLERYGGITDIVTTVDPSHLYPVRVATAHPVFENARVEQFARLLETLAQSPANAVAMGRLMRESHDSYGACGLGSEGTDRLVAMVDEAGEGSGLLGAKITGGGSGGTVAILGTVDAEVEVRSLAARYTGETGRAAEVFAGSGAGLAERPVLTRHVLW